MEETLTVVKLALPALLRQSLATTNAIENLNGTIRRVSRNVKRWKSPSMVRRWTALGVVTAQKEFRRIKGYRHMGALVHALLAGAPNPIFRRGCIGPRCSSSRIRSSSVGIETWLSFNEAAVSQPPSRRSS